MKKIWKVLGAAALVAGLVPYKAEQDLATGEKTYDALLWQLKTRPDAETGKPTVEVSILPNRRPSKAKQEAALFDDEVLCPCDGGCIQVEAAPVEEPACDQPANEEAHFDPNF